MAPAPRFWVAAPATTPLPYGLLSVATVIDGDTLDPQWRQGIRFESNQGDVVRATLNACLDDANEGDAEPTGQALDITRGVTFPEGAAFTLYAGHKCSAGGRTREQDIARAGRLLTNGEAVTLERVIETGGESDGLDDPIVPCFTSDPPTIEVDEITPPTIAASLALAERQARSTGLGSIIHVRADIASYLSHTGGALLRNGSRLETVLGTPLAVGGGYTGAPPDGTDRDPDDFAFMYVTGAVEVIRGPIESLDPVSILDRTINDVMVFAERTYAVAWDGTTFAIPVPLAELAA